MKLNNNHNNKISFNGRPRLSPKGAECIREVTTTFYSDSIFAKLPKNPTWKDFQDVFVPIIGYVPFGTYIRFLQWKLQGKSYGMRLRGDLNERTDLYRALERQTAVDHKYVQITTHDKRYGIAPNPQATDDDVAARVHAQRYLNSIPILAQFEKCFVNLNECIRRNSYYLGMKMNDKKFIKRGQILNEKQKQAQAIYKICVEKCMQLGNAPTEAQKSKTLRECNDLLNEYLCEFDGAHTARTVNYSQRRANNSTKKRRIDAKSKEALRTNAADIANIKTEIDKIRRILDKIDASAENNWIKTEYHKMLAELQQKLDELL